jgi:hypothetical protein
VVYYAMNPPSCPGRVMIVGGQKGGRMVKRYLSYMIVRVYLTKLLFRRDYCRSVWMLRDGSGRKLSYTPH